MFRKILITSSMLMLLFTCFGLGGTALAASSSQLRPATISPTDCTSNIYNFEIDSNDHTTVQCFTGTGYQGLGVQDVDQITNHGGSNMWIRYYLNGTGFFCTIPRGKSTAFDRPDPTYIGITQVDYGASKGGTCPGTE